MNSEKREFSTDERLSLCASFVRVGTRLADIGTDHGYLPIRLALDGKIESAVAADIREKPLKSAENNIQKFGVKNVKTVLSDGLKEVSPEDAYDIVIAGMGGELIASIIENAPWLREGNRRLILQPMTRADSLRSFLCSNGFNIIAERACVCAKKVYSVIVSEYDGEIRECSAAFKYLGLLIYERGFERDMYISSVVRKLQKKINGLRKSGNLDEADKYEQELKAVNDCTIIKIKNIMYPTPLEKIEDTSSDSIDIFVETESGLRLTFTVCTPQFYISYMKKSGKRFVPAGQPDIIVSELTDNNIREAVADYCENDGYWLKSYYMLGLAESEYIDKMFDEITRGNSD